MHSEALTINERENADIIVRWNWHKFERIFDVVILNKHSHVISTITTADPDRAKEVFDHPMVFV